MQGIGLWLDSAQQSGGYLRLTQPQLYPLQGLTDDATLFLFHTAALQRLQALLWLLQVLQEAAVFPSQRLQPSNHLLRTAENFLSGKHGIQSEVPLLGMICNTRGRYNSPQSTQTEDNPSRARGCLGS